MKRVGSFLGGVVIGALVFGTVFGFVGYELGHFGEPSVIVRNLTQSPIHVRTDTDVGESYALNDIDPAASRRTGISGRDTVLWIAATTSTGETRKSEQIDVTSQGTVFVAVTEQSITIDYEL
jgi:hypothetical protein